MNNLPQASYAVIGGSGTLSSDFPLNTACAGITLLEDGVIVDTPYGKTPPLRFFSLAAESGEKRVVTCKMHGWRSGISRADASRQIFWAFRAAGVKRILAEGGVGSVNHLLDPRDFVIPHDYIDWTVRKDVGLEGRYLLVMRDALCLEMRRILIEEAKTRFSGRIFTRGVYAVTDGRHFESPAEIAMLKGQADIVGQSLCPEVYLAREIGACYAGLYFVVNYGEGVVKNWSHEQLKDIFFDDAPLIGSILIETLRRLPDQAECECASLRKETLLKGIYS